MLLSIVVWLYSIAVNLLADSPVMANLSAPFTVTFKYTYQYGHKDARGGQDPGGPRFIPQYQDDGSGSSAPNFRIFINPPISP